MTILEKKNTLLSDTRIQLYKKQFYDAGLPFQDTIDSILIQHGDEEYALLIKAALAILETELSKCISKPATTIAGKIIRFLAKIIGVKASIK